MKYELSSFEYRQMIIGKTYESYTSWNAWISNWKHHEFLKLFCWIWINKIIVKGIFLITISAIDSRFFNFKY